MVQLRLGSKNSFGRLLGLDLLSRREFHNLLEEIFKMDREELMKVYGGWATGQPFRANLPIYKFFLSGADKIEDHLMKYLRRLLKGGDGRINVVSGEFGSGKTQLILYISALARDKFNLDTLYYSLEDKSYGDERIIDDIEERADAHKGKMIMAIDHLEKCFWREENPIKAIDMFFSSLNASIRGHLGRKTLSIIVSINREWFDLLRRYKLFRGGGRYKLNSLLDTSRSQEIFIDHMVQSSMKLLALHYVLEYYNGFRRKIDEYYEEIISFIYDMVHRISRFGVRSMGLGLKMLNDRLVDFIKYIRGDAYPRDLSEIEKGKDVMLSYLKDRFNNLILTFDRPWGFSRYRINFVEDKKGDMLGFLEVESLEGDFERDIRGRITVYACDSTSMRETEKMVLERIRDNEHIAVIHFFKKKRGIREEIEKVYLKNSGLMANFSIIPIDLNILNFAFKLDKMGHSVFVEKNTTAKRDLEEAINTLVNVKLLETIEKLPREAQDCNHVVLALYLWAQVWLGKSGFCRVKRRDINVVRKFFDSLFPNVIMNVDRNEIIRRLIRELAEERVIFVNHKELKISDKVNDDVVLEKIVDVARKLFCRL